MTYYMLQKKREGETLHYVLHDGVMRRMVRFQHFTLLQ